MKIRSWAGWPPFNKKQQYTLSTHRVDKHQLDRASPMVTLLRARSGRPGFDSQRRTYILFNFAAPLQFPVQPVFFGSIRPASSAGFLRVSQVAARLRYGSYTARTKRIIRLDIGYQPIRGPDYPRGQGPKRKWSVCGCPYTWVQWHPLNV